MPSLQGCSKRSPLMLVETSEGQSWSWLVPGNLSPVRGHGLLVKKTLSLAFNFRDTSPTLPLGSIGGTFIVVEPTEHFCE